MVSGLDSQHLLKSWGPQYFLLSYDKVKSALNIILKLMQIKENGVKHILNGHFKKSIRRIINSIPPIKSYIGTQRMIFELFPRGGPRNFLNFFSKTIIIGIGSMKISVFFGYRYMLSVKARYIGIGWYSVSVNKKYRYRYRWYR